MDNPNLKGIRNFNPNFISAPERMLRICLP